jgi:hypothetical protein
LWAAAWLAAAAAGAASAQTVRIAQREVEPPDYATFRMGPFYSTVLWTETAGYRYTRSSGTGTDYLVDNDRGAILKDGSDFPILSSLTFRNYLILTRNIDVDASVRVGYNYYPLDTQEDEFYFDMADEGVYGSLSSKFRISPYLTGALYDNAVYRTDYVDTRGETDTAGGRRYQYFANTVGGGLTWLLSRTRTLSLNARREDWWPQGDNFEEQERTVHAVSASLEQELQRDLTAGLRAGETWHDYKSPSRRDGRVEDVGAFAKASRGNSTLQLGAGLSTGYQEAQQQTSGADAVSDSDEQSKTTETSAQAELETRLRRDLTHSLGYTRGLRGGFNSTFELHEQYAYRLDWKGERARFGVSSVLSSIEPEGGAASAYRTWANTASAARDVARNTTLTLTSTYTTRENDAVTAAEAEDLDAEDLNDYETWVTRLAARVQLTPRHLSLETYVEHIERFSGSEDLAYTRDTAAAYLTYSRPF